jgi:tetratricopeptide (TPR) repeat protein
MTGIRCNFNMRAGIAGCIADPNSEMGSFLHRFGNECKSNRAFVTAVIVLKRASELSPDDPDIMCDLGANLWNYGDYVSALDVLFKSIRIRPFAIAHVNMGLVLASMKEYKNAEWHYKQSLRLNHDYLGAKWNLALLHLGMGNWEVGFEEYECRINYRG